MKKYSFLAFDMLRKEEIASIKGGKASDVKKCGCTCVGPLTPMQVGINAVDRETDSSDEECNDCGATNAHRATNGLIQH